MLAIISKDIFEKTRTQDGTPLAVGDVYGAAVYVSTNRALLAQLDGDLYLVTVRGDRLWWVGTLRAPTGRPGRYVRESRQRRRARPR